MSRTTVVTKPQVFLSFALVDRDLAQSVSTTLARSGLNVIGIDDMSSNGEISEDLREGIAESAAVVVVLSNARARQEIPASVLFEIGAAVGANKPVFVVVDRMTGKLPFGVPNLHILPINRVEEIARRLMTST